MIYLGIGDVDAVIHLTLAQALYLHVLAYLLAEGGVAGAFLFQGGLELGQVELVLAGYPFHGLVELALIHAYAGISGVIGQHLLVDQPVQHLAPQHVLGGEGDLLALQVGSRAAYPGIEFVLGDDGFVHHRHDAIQRQRVGGMGRGQQAGGKQGGGKAGQGSGHGQFNLV